MANQVTDYGSKSTQSEGKSNSTTETMHVYGSGDSMGTKRMEKGAEIMRKRSEPGTQNESTYTEKGETEKTPTP